VDRQDPETVFLSVFIIGELHKGIRQLPDSPRNEEARKPADRRSPNALRGPRPSAGRPSDEDLWVSMLARIEAAGSKMVCITS
jgi:hypothetical protein